MPNISQMMQKAAKQIGRFDTKLVRGALSYTWDGKEIGYVGLPVDAFFPKALPKLTNWLKKSAEATEDADWNAMFHGGHTAPERSKSLITGLAEGGAAEQMRRQLTAFGSGWQGNKFKDGFERVVGRNFSTVSSETLGKLWEGIAPHATKEVEFLGGGQEHMVFDIGEEKVVKIGFGAEQLHPNIPEVLQPHASGFVDAEEIAYKGGLHYHVMPKVDTTPISYAEVTEMSNALANRGYAVDEAIGNFGRYQGKKVLIDVGGMSKLSKEVMKAGEGEAISKAGTSLVKAVLKKGSRIIKNGL